MNVPPNALQERNVLDRRHFNTFILLWITYASFYLCRMNFSAAIPLIQRSFDLSNIETGRIMSAFFIAYGIGQLINGALVDRFGVRVVLFIGMMGSVLANAFFAFAASVTAMTIPWALNGYFQSAGWPSIIRVTAHWFPMRLRGRVLGLLATSFQLGNVASWLLSFSLVGWLSLSYGSLFYVPSVIMAAVALLVLVRIKESPDDVSPSRDSASPSQSQQRSVVRIVCATLSQPAIWLLALSYLFLCIVRFGFLTWTIDYLSSENETTVGHAALMASLIPLAGCLGTVAAGWASDRLFHSRRAPVAVLLLFLLGACILIFAHMPSSFSLQIILLCMIGVAIHGPEMLIVSASAADLGFRTAATASGFINSMGHIGAIVQALITPYIRYKCGIKGAYSFWAICAIIAACTMCFLWNTNGNTGQLSPSSPADAEVPGSRQRVAGHGD